MVDDGPPGEFAERKQFGDWTVDWSAEFVKDAGEDGGARREGCTALFWLVNPATWGPFCWFAVAWDSGIRDAGTTRFPPFCKPKQDKPVKHPPHLFRREDAGCCCWRNLVCSDAILSELINESLSITWILKESQVLELHLLDYRLIGSVVVHDAFALIDIRSVGVHECVSG